MTTMNTGAASLSDDPMCRHCYNRKSMHTAEYAACPEEGMGNFSFSALVDATPTPQADAAPISELALLAAGAWANADTPVAEALAYRDGYVAGFRAIAAGGAQEAIYQVMVGEKWVDSTSAEYAAVSNEKRIVYASPLPRVAATVALTNLEGLRARLLAPRVIARDKDGWLWHPDYPVCDEGTRADKFLEAFGIETAFVGMESDAPDLAERWHEEGLTDCSEWTPTPPGGDGWLLLEIYDTEDGPHAMFGRDHHAAEQARKKEHTRRLSEAVRRARLERAAASNGEQ